MLYTRKGDAGTTKRFGCNQRISKSSAVAEALGSLDEANSFIGLLRAKCAVEEPQFSISGLPFKDILLGVQNDLFIIQAETAGAEGKTIASEKIRFVEKIVDAVEKELPPIKSFFVPGATEISAMFDVARTVSRRAERRVVAVSEEGAIKIGEHSLAYLNRLSSLLYALARYANYLLGAGEKSPDYK